MCFENLTEIAVWNWGNWVKKIWVSFDPQCKSYSGMKIKKHDVNIFLNHSYDYPQFYVWDPKRKTDFEKNVTAE